MLLLMTAVLGQDPAPGPGGVEVLKDMIKEQVTHPDTAAPGPAAPAAPAGNFWGEFGDLGAKWGDIGDVKMGGPGVEGLYTLASNNEAKSGEQMNKAHTMGNTQDAAYLAAENARKRAVAAGEAQIANDFSSKTYKQASSLAAEAAAARQKAIQAKDAADKMKEKFDNMASVETRQMAAAQESRKLQKKTMVLSEAKDLEVKNLKAALSEAQMKSAGCKEQKKSIDDTLDMAKREQQHAADGVAKAKKSAMEAQTTWELAVAAADKAAADSTAAMNEQASWSIKLGGEQANTAKSEVEEDEAEKERALARTVADTAIAEAHNKIESATELESQASAAVTEANVLVAKAKAKADKVSYAAGSNVPPVIQPSTFAANVAAATAAGPAAAGPAR